MARSDQELQRWTIIAKGPKPSLQTRVALIVHQRGITKRQLAKFHTLRGKHFDYIAFAKAQKISLDWLIDGILAKHPRMPAPRPEKQPRQQVPLSEQREFARLLKTLPEKYKPVLLAQMRQLLDK
jgi:hypothetical protein